jgi:ketosteroid isomerase-like protein
MKLFHAVQYALLAAALSVLACNNPGHNKAGVESAMQQYDHFIQKMDTDSIALLYAPDGDLGKMAHGRDSIRRFLGGFKNMQVLSQASTSDTVQLKGDTALQTGTYHQTVIVSAKDTVKVKGAYTATWRWTDKQGWLIQRMETKPLP